MHRFFVPSPQLERDPVVLTGPVTHQLSRVLRMRPGEHIVLLDNSGWAYEAELEHVAPDRVTVHLLSKERPETETGVRLMLYQSLTREKQFAWVLQKGTELGVSTFVPMVTERSIVTQSSRVSDRRMVRWQRIVTEAAEQSGRTRVPEVAVPTCFARACVPPEPGTLGLVASVGGEAMPLRQALRQADPELDEIRLFVGPEGGFAPEEIERARQVGMQLVSLGPRILRTETAGIAALSAILYALGEMG